MFEEDLNAWRQVSICQSLLENLLRDIARLEEAIDELLGESDDTSDSSRDTVYASDDAVREIVASIVEVVKHLDAELDMKQELLSSDCAQEAMATWGSDWRANEHSPSGIWFFDAPSLRQRIRRLVIQVQPDEPLTSVSFGSYIDYFQTKQKQAIRSLNELEATPAVKDLRYREALVKHRQHPTPAVSAVYREPVAESRANLTPGVETADGESGKESLAVKEMPRSDETSNSIVSSAAAQPAEAQISPAGSWDEASTRVTADATIEPLGDGGTPQGEVSNAGTLAAKEEPLDDAHDRGRRCYGRDHRFLRWKKEEDLKPAAIRDRWNSMSDDERKAICPEGYRRIGGGSNKKGRTVVVTALKKAECEEKNENSEKKTDLEVYPRYPHIALPSIPGLPPNIPTPQSQVSSVPYAGTPVCDATSPR
jgi:hypothetical protein